MLERNERHRQALHSAHFLGWFSIGLGLAEIFAARPMARMLGMRGSETLLRLYGLREVATGVGIFTAKDKAAFVWGRVGGDALDLATLAAHFEGNPRKGALTGAVAAVAGVAMLDAVTARELSMHERLAALPARDYSGRTGFPQGVASARGAARGFETPRDMRSGFPEPRSIH